jgi:hypothetical protein
MTHLIGSTWVLVFVGVVAAGASGLRLALSPAACEPMDRTSAALCAVAATCGLAAPALVALT